MWLAVLAVVAFVGFVLWSNARDAEAQRHKALAEAETERQREEYRAFMARIDAWRNLFKLAREQGTDDATQSLVDVADRAIDEMLVLLERVGRAPEDQQAAWGPGLAAKIQETCLLADEASKAFRNAGPTKKQIEALNAMDAERKANADEATRAIWAAEDEMDALEADLHRAQEEHRLRNVQLALQGLPAEPDPEAIVEGRAQVTKMREQIAEAIRRYEEG